MSYEPNFFRDACVFLGSNLIMFVVAWKLSRYGITRRIIRIAGKAHQDGFEKGYAECANQVQHIEQIARRN